MKIKGKDFHVFIESGTGDAKTYKTVACAKSHKLDVSRDTIDVASKDSGEWSEKTTGKLSWNAGVDAMVCRDENGDSYDELLAIMIAGTELTIVSNVAEGAIGPNGWTPLKAGLNRGKAIITSLSLSASDGDIATYSASFEGTGPLTPATGV